MKPDENPGKIMKKHWTPKKLKKHEWMMKKPKKSLNNKWKPTNKTRKPKKNTRKTNENQWTKTMRSKKQHMKFIENQRKSMNTSRKNQWEPQKPMKNQRRNNEKQWKTKDIFASILSYFCQRFLFPVFSRFSSSLGKEIRDNFDGKKTVLTRLGDRGFIKPYKHAVHMCFKQGYFSVCCFLGTLWRKSHCTERT